MDIVILTTIVLVGIVAESLVINRARKRAEYEEAVQSRLSRYAGRRAQ